MSTPWLMSIVLFALAGAISPGPVNLLATAVGSQAGFVRALETGRQLLIPKKPAHA